MSKKNEIKSCLAGAVITLHSGRVKLTEDQANRRASCLSNDKKGGKAGVYNIEKPIQFKLGEVFGYDGEIPKSMLDEVIEIDAESQTNDAESQK